MAAEILAMDIGWWRGREPTWAREWRLRKESEERARKLNRALVKSKMGKFAIRTSWRWKLYGSTKRHAEP